MENKKTKTAAELRFESKLRLGAFNRYACHINRKRKEEARKIKSLKQEKGCAMV